MSTTWADAITAVATAGALVSSSLLALARLRQRRHERPQSKIAPPPLNGYASLLREALARIDELREINEYLYRDRESLLKRLEEATHRRVRQLDKPPATRKRTPAAATSAKRAAHNS